jgi:ubiquinone/menaquinone biosynthesis C-methylase UbiE
MHSRTVNGRTTPDSDRHTGPHATHHAGRHYLPAAGHHWRLPFYDLMGKLVGAVAARRELVEQVAPRAGERVLDVGSGPGGLAIALKRLYPGADVVGLDPDPRALAIARREAARASLAIRFDEGFADALPYADATFDRVTSSLMFHHLPVAEREGALREARRVLAPGGSLHMLDFAGPLPRGAGRLARRIHSNPHLRDSAEDRVLGLLRAAGFADARVVARRAGTLAHMVYYEARTPRAPGVA